MATVTNPSRGPLASAGPAGGAPTSGVTNVSRSGPPGANPIPSGAGSGGGSPLDFRTLMATSNAENQAERAAKSKGDFSSLRDQDSFFRELEAQTTGRERKPRNTMDKNDFLRLFVTQLQHQDPLKPKEGSEMAAELAQFNSLEQMVNMNTSLDKLARAQDQNRATSLLNYIGKSITLNHGRIGIQDKEPIRADYRMPVPVRQGTLSLRNEQGVEVLNKELGNIAAGSHNLDLPSLNGKGDPLPPGAYFFEISGVDDQDNTIRAEVQSRVNVAGIDLHEQGGGFYTNAGKVTLDEVVAIGETGRPPATKESTSPTLSTPPAPPFMPATPPPPADAAPAAAPAPLAQAAPAESQRME